MADYGQNSDPSDFLNSGVQGGNDPFNEYYGGGTLQSLTTADKQQLDALGFHTLTPPTTGHAPASNLFGSTIHDVVSAGGEVYALYDAILGRTPDPLGFEGWASILKHGTASLHDVAASFLASPEGQSHVGSPNNATFVEQLYETALHRPGDSNGVQGWTNALNQGASRADVAIGFALSAEHVAECKPA